MTTTNFPKGFALSHAPDCSAIVRCRIKENAIPGFAITGYAGNNYSREIRDRMRAALLSQGYVWPLGRITVEVLTGDGESGEIRGGDTDTLVAAAILLASGQEPGHTRSIDYPMVCLDAAQLTLDGRVLSGRGAR